ncbi:hypothetical protein, partial [Zooshikella sp. RANM57]|uniref:Tc toxin subunit A-related protein n=1 Tax=Zooshikella sp. RANM57 TaxID=3425863 RepID=UPI003D6E62E1
DGNISDLLFQYTHLAPTNCESFLCLPPIIGCTSQYLVAVSSSTALQAVAMQAPVPSGAQALFQLNNQNLPENEVEAFFDALNDKNLLAINQDFPPQNRFNFNGTHGQYGWEFFYHLPSMIASAAMDNQQYETATQWFKQIYNPSEPVENKWGVLPIKNAFSGAHDRTSTFLGFNDPDKLASQNPEYYGYATIRQYLQMLIQMGDDQYNLMTQETLQKAKMIYVEAQGLLNIEQPDDLFDLSQEVWTNPSLDDVLQGNAELLPPLNYEMYALTSELSERINNLRNWQDMDGEPLNVPLYAPKINPRDLQKANQQGKGSSKTSDQSKLNVLDALEYPLISLEAKDKVNRLIRLNERIVDTYDKLDAYNIKLTYQVGVTTGYEDRDRDQEGVFPEYSKNEFATLDLDNLPSGFQSRTPQFIQELMIRQSDSHLEAARSRLAEVCSEFAVTSVYYLQSLVRLGWSFFRTIPNLKEIKGLNKEINEANIVLKSQFYSESEKNKARDNNKKAKTKRKLLYTKSLAKIPATFVSGTSFGGSDPITSDVIQALNSNTDQLDTISDDINNFLISNLAEYAKQAAISLASYSSQIAELTYELRAARLEKKINIATFNMEDSAYGSEKANEGAIRNAILNNDHYTASLNNMNSIFKTNLQLTLQMCHLAEDVYNKVTEQSASFFPDSIPNIPIEKLVLSSTAYQYEQNLMEMDVAYQEWKKANPTNMNTVVFSLLSDFGDKTLKKLREQGSCEFSLDNDLFDAYQPNQRNRRIKDIKLQFNGINEADKPLSALLVQTGHQVFMQNTEKASKDFIALHNKLVLNGAETDTTVVQWPTDNPMPFKGTGAVSSWRLVIPCLDKSHAKRSKRARTAKQVAVAKEMQNMLDNHLKDVTIEITYSAIQC